MPKPFANNALLAEVFVLIEQPSSLAHWRAVLAPFDARQAPPITSVVTYYDARSEIVLLDVQYDARRFGEAARKYVVDIVVAAGVGMIQPAKLSDDERARFLDARLSRCALRLEAQPTVARALHELENRLAASRAVAVHATLPRRVPARPPPIPVRAGKGTRQNLEQVLQSADDESTSRYQAPRCESPRKPESPRRDDEDRITSPLDLAAFQAMAAGARRPDRVRVRYLRGGRWTATRVVALGLGGVTLLAGALPQLHDHVDVALAFGDHRAIVRGVVGKVAENTATGSPVFTLRFVLDDHSRPRLTALLAAARNANVTIKPPPLRASRRFPVEWRVELGTTNGVVNVAALDVSDGGMFVRPTVPLLLDTTVSFSLVLEDGTTPITGRASVVRMISEYQAQECGLVAGFGLEIVDMSDVDRSRWRGLVARTQRRADKRVLISAHPARLVELQATLASLGYAVIAGTDPAMLVEFVNSQTRAADAVFIDAGGLQSEASMTIAQELLASRNIPYIKMHADVARVRLAIDRVLAVVRD